MKVLKGILMIIFIAIAINTEGQTAHEFPVLKGEYLGQNLVDTIPEIFAKDIVSDSTWYEHSQLAISPKGDEIYWSAFSRKYQRPDGEGNTQQIYYSKLENDRWTKPDLAEFIKEDLTISRGGPVFSPDGSRMYFYSERPGGLGGMDVWYVLRENEKWSEPINVGRPYNSEYENWSPSFSKKGHAYHMAYYNDNPNEKPIQFVYENNCFKDSAIVKIHPEFSPYYSFYVSPDEDYMIFSGHHYLGAGVLDLYICYKDEQGNWGYPIMLTDQINTETVERFPVVSPDGKFLFFVRQNDTHYFYWVSTKILEKYRSESLEKMKTTPNIVDIKLQPEEIGQYLGVYSPAEPSFSFTISSEDSSLKIKMGKDVYKLQRYARNKFKYANRMLLIEFFPEENRMFLQCGAEKLNLIKQ